MRMDEGMLQSYLPADQVRPGPLREDDIGREHPGNHWTTSLTHPTRAHAPDMTAHSHFRRMRLVAAMVGGRP